MLVLIHNVTNELQFIPARGRKLLNHGLRSSHTEIAIYPREGTETN